MPRSSYPAPPSKVCPKCGSKKYRSAPAGDSLVIQKERICKECETRYSPPIPPWAPFGAMLAGAAVLTFAGLNVYDRYVSHRFDYHFTWPYTIMIVVTGVAIIGWGVILLVSPPNMYDRR
jgi:hypothetical protein